MTDDFSITLAALSAQRTELEIKTRELRYKMRDCHIAAAGASAPLGRTSLRDALEATIGETRALIKISDDDVGHVVNRLAILETETENLDLRLGAEWEDIPL
mgnify:CR=1 FL=1